MCFLYIALMLMKIIEKMEIVRKRIICQQMAIKISNENTRAARVAIQTTRKHISVDKLDIKALWKALMFGPSGFRATRKMIILEHMAIKCNQEINHSRQHLDGIHKKNISWCISLLVNWKKLLNKSTCLKIRTSKR